MGYEISSALNAPDEPSGDGDDHGSGSSRDPPPPSDNVTYRAEGDISQSLRREAERPSITISIPRSQVNADTTTEPVAENGRVVPPSMRNFPARFGIQNFEEIMPTTSNAAVSVHRTATIPWTEVPGWPNSFVQSTFSVPHRPPPTASRPFGNTFSTFPNYSIPGNLTSPAIGRGMDHLNFGYNTYHQAAQPAWGFHGFLNVGSRLIPHAATPQFFPGLQWSPPVPVRSALHTGTVDPPNAVATAVDPFLPFVMTPQPGPQTTGFHLPHTWRGPPNAAFLPASSSSSAPRASSSSRRVPRPPQRSRARSRRKNRAVRNPLDYRGLLGFRISPPRERIRWKDPDQRTKCSGSNCFLCKRDLSAEPGLPLFKLADEWPSIDVLPCKHAFHHHCFELVVAAPADEQSTQQRQPACPACAAEAGEETC